MSDNTTNNVSASGWIAPDKDAVYAANGDRSTLLRLIPENVPAALRERSNWVGWELRSSKSDKDKLAKTPVALNHLGQRGYVNAKSDDRRTWVAWWKVLQELNSVRAKQLGGVAFMFGPGKETDGVTGIDLDKCRKPDTGELSPQALKIVAALPGYWEASPSGTGIKGFFLGTMPTTDGKGKKGPLPDAPKQDVEVYDRGRLFCVTGHKIDGATDDVQPLPEAFAGLFAKWFPEKEQKKKKGTKARAATASGAPASSPDELLAVMFAAKNGSAIRALWEGDTSAYGGDDSRADAALLAHLAFYCRKDAALMESMFSRSGLGQRDKWTERPDYRERSIANAISLTGEVYSGRRAVTFGPVPSSPGGATAGTATAERFPDTDMANGSRFVADHREDAIYVADMKRWFIFDGRRWHEDATETLVLGLAQQTARSMADHAYQAIVQAAAMLRDAEGEGKGEDGEGRANAALARAKAAMSWAKQSQDMKRISAMIKAARPGLMVPRGCDLFDRAAHLLPCVNGTVDMTTGELRPHAREDYLTKLCPTAYRADAQAPTYAAFLNSVLGSPEEVDYIRRLSGYTVTGEVTSQTLHIFHGTGSNGKNVLLDLWLKVLGEIAVTAPPELVADKGEHRHPTEKTVVRGRRLAVCEETEDDERLNAKRVKQLTGGGNIVARGMQQNFFEFAPTHKLIVSTNTLPEVRTNDHATWRRIRLVNFPRVFWTEADRLRDPCGTFPEHQRADSGLPKRLLGESEGVLAEMVRNAVAFYAAGRTLNAPSRVMTSVAEYRKREDHGGRWLDLYTTAAPFDRDDAVCGVRGERGMVVYQRFKSWFVNEVDHDEDKAPTKRAFCVRLATKYKTRTLDGNEHYGLKLLAQPAESEDGASGEVGN